MPKDSKNNCRKLYDLQDNDYAPFFKVLMHLCNLKGISLNKAIVDNGFSRASLERWKKGTRPNPKTLRTFAAYFNITVDDFFNGGAVFPSSKNQMREEHQSLLSNASYEQMKDIMRFIKEYYPDLYEKLDPIV